MIYFHVLFTLFLLSQLLTNVAYPPIVSLVAATTTTATASEQPAAHQVPQSCNNTDASLVRCDFNTTCVYGELNTVKCRVSDEISCQGDKSFAIQFPCLYCWQLPEDHYSCSANTTCKPLTRYQATCDVNSTTYCLGQREFLRYKTCKPITGHRWSMTMALSVFFGGFGVDRFYLGHWQEGIGKLFSFGGFGVWTLIDTILISIGYLKPADSAEYEL